MVAKKRKTSKAVKECNNSVKVEKHIHAQELVEPETQVLPCEENVTSTETVKKRVSTAKRSVCPMHKVLVKKAQGKKIKFRYNARGDPVGDTRHTLQSYIGMLGRTMVPINFLSWPKADL